MLPSTDLSILPRVRDSWSFLYIERSTIDQDQHAIAVRDQAQLDLEHTVVRAPEDSIVASVDVLGIATEVRADQGGIVAVLKVTSGDPVEYGQELFLLESIGEGAK